MYFEKKVKDKVFKMKLPSYTIRYKLADLASSGKFKEYKFEFFGALLGFCMQDHPENLKTYVQCGRDWIEFGEQFFDYFAAIMDGEDAVFLATQCMDELSKSMIRHDELEAAKDPT
jgi:hypothetical protein